MVKTFLYKYKGKVEEKKALKGGGKNEVPKEKREV